MDCVACGTPLAKDALFCHKCGTKAEVVCLNCGKILVKEAMFCSLCGTKVNNGNCRTRLTDTSSQVKKTLEPLPSDIKQKSVIKNENDEEVEYFVVTTKDGLMGILDKRGEYTITPGKFEVIESTISKGGIKVSKDKLWGFVDINGNILIPPIYHTIRDQYTICDMPTILAYPLVDDKMGDWFYINYKNETDDEQGKKYIAKMNGQIVI